MHTADSSSFNNNETGYDVFYIGSNSQIRVVNRNKKQQNGMTMRW